MEVDTDAFELVKDQAASLPGPPHLRSTFTPAIFTLNPGSSSPFCPASPVSLASATCSASPSLALASSATAPVVMPTRSPLGPLNGSLNPQLPVISRLLGSLN